MSFKGVCQLEGDRNLYILAGDLGWKEIGNLWRLAGDWGLKKIGSLCGLKGFTTWKT